MVIHDTRADGTAQMILPSHLLSLGVVVKERTIFELLDLYASKVSLPQPKRSDDAKPGTIAFKGGKTEEEPGSGAPVAP